MTRPFLRARPALTATLVAGLLTAAVPAVAAPGDPVPEPPAPVSPSAELPDVPRFPRTAGEDREATAVRVSRLAFQAGASVAYVATSRTYADALAGGPLAASDDAPLLLVNPAGLDAVVAGEIDRLGVDEVVILGGTAAVPAAVEAQIADLGVATSRIQGTDRFQTARRIAQRLTGGSADTVFVVEGQDPDPGRGWPDAVSVSAYAAHVGAPIVPVVTDAVPAASQALLDGLAASEVVLIGGTAAISADVEAALTPSDEDAGVTVRRLAGADRFATSAAVYDEAVTRGA